MGIHWRTFEDIRHTCPCRIGNWHILPRTFHLVSVNDTTKIDVKTYITSAHERFNTLNFVFSTFRVDNKLWFWLVRPFLMNAWRNFYFSFRKFWNFRKLHLEAIFFDNRMKMKYFHKSRDSEKLENLFASTDSSLLVDTFDGVENFADVVDGYTKREKNDNIEW